MGINVRQAATRIFSNASGSYSSNVNLAVENSSWSDEQQLQEMYLSRKSFAFNSDRYACLLHFESVVVLLYSKIGTFIRALSLDILLVAIAASAQY